MRVAVYVSAMQMRVSPSCLESCSAQADQAVVAVLGLLAAVGFELHSSQVKVATHHRKLVEDRGVSSRPPFDLDLLNGDEVGVEILSLRKPLSKACEIQVRGSIHCIIV